MNPDTERWWVNNHNSSQRNFSKTTKKKSKKNPPGLGWYLIFHSAFSLKYDLYVDKKYDDEKTWKYIIERLTWSFGALWSNACFVVITSCWIEKKHQVETVTWTRVKWNYVRQLLPQLYCLCAPKAGLKKKKADVHRMLTSVLLWWLPGVVLPGLEDAGSAAMRMRKARMIGETEYRSMII